jgi:phosphoribosyl 1,2-cyclic phosphodiesterase
MRVTFWGTRGSLPTPLTAVDVRGKIVTALSAARGRLLETPAEIDTLIDALPFSITGTYGGNSPCVQIDESPAEDLVCDAGSGLRVYGQRMLARYGRTPRTYHLFMSHMHWDHIMGFPFFTPAYIPGNRICIYAVHPNVEEAFRRQHGPPSFPVPFDGLGATIEFVPLTAGEPHEIAGHRVRALLQPHGGDSYAYRFERDGKAIVYATDAEHKFVHQTDAQPFVAFFHDADLLIFDAMYSLGDAVSIREDWGHSSNVVGVELAHEAHVKHLVLFHHEPVHDDATIERILAETRRFAQILENAHLVVSSAYDGLVIDV